MTAQTPGQAISENHEAHSQKENSIPVNIAFATEDDSLSTFFSRETLKEGLKHGCTVCKDPEIYSKFMAHLEKKVKRDPAIKSAIVKTSLSAYTPDPLNLGLKGPSCLGKTYEPMEILKYFPQKDVMLLGRLSKTALIHSYGILCDENGKEIDNANKPTRESVKAELHDFYSNIPETKVTSSMVNEELDRQKKIWREKMEKSYYVVDLKNKILVFLEAPDPGVFMVLRPILSHDAREISYKITDKTSSGSLRTKTVIIRNWPAVILCTTALDFLEDIATRFITATPEISKEKFAEANQVTGAKNAFPWEFQEDYDFSLLQGYIGWLSSMIPDYEVIVPYAVDLGKAYPSYYARSMRDLAHFLSLVKVSALFHLAQRPVITVGGKDYLMATRWDYQHVAETWLDVEETTLTGLPGNVLNLFHKAIEPLGEGHASFEELTIKYNEEANKPKSSDTVRKWVKLLCEIGWCTKEPDPVDKRKVIISVIKKRNNNGESRIPAFNSFFSETKLKLWQDRVKKMSEDKPILLKENIHSEYIKDSISNMPTSILNQYFFIKETEEKPLCKTLDASVNFSDTSEPETSPETETKPEESGIRQSPPISEPVDKYFPEDQNNQDPWFPTCKLCNKTIQLGEPMKPYGNLGNCHVSCIEKDLSARRVHPGAQKILMEATI